MKPHVILLNDITLRSPLRVNRYIGPYVLASQLEAAGFRTLVIDWFTEIPDFFAYLENFLSQDLLFVGLASTFLTQPLNSSHDYQNNKPLRTDQARNYFGGHLWFSTTTELQDWLSQLRLLLDKYNPSCKIALGGAKVAHLWKSTSGQQKDPYQLFDFLFMGAAENKIVEILQALRNQNPITSHERAGRQFIFCPSSETTSCPRTHWQPHWAVLPKEGLPIEISRGCTFNCKFCHYEKRQSRRKDLTCLRDEFIFNYEQFGTTSYHFCDDCFNDSREKVEAICRMILDLPFQIDWISYARVDVAVKFPHTMDLMIQSGARGLWWGLESFNAEAARRAGKGTPPDQVKKALLDFRRKYREACFFQASFIVGLPHETRESQLSTLDWLLENDVLDFASFGVLGLLEYHEDIDHTAMDFADYTRNPGKYGFQKVSWNPYYWEHDTMNSHVAQELAEHCQTTWMRHKGSPFFKFIWSYPQLKSLGFCHEDIVSMAREPQRSTEWSQIVQRHQNLWYKLYRDELLKRNFSSNTLMAPERPIFL